MQKIKLGQSTAFGDVYKIVKERLSEFEKKIKQAKLDAKKNDPTKIKFFFSSCFLLLSKQ